MKKAVCVISGGMDSTLCAYIAKSMGYDIIALHFDYNQRTMIKERESFNKICDDLGVGDRLILDASFIANIGGNALTDRSIKIPTDGISNAITSTYVPFRNGIFISIAAALAERHDCSAIFVGVVQEDSSGYPDCTQDFIDSMNKTINCGTAKKNIKIITPLIHLSKEEIVLEAIKLNVPLEFTWSCYENNEVACGVCDSCRLRLKGFLKAGVVDKIAYARHILQ